MSQAVKGRKEVRDILEEFSKSDISGAERARLRYGHYSGGILWKKEKVVKTQEALHSCGFLFVG